MYTAGYNFSELIRHSLFEKPKSDFIEMMFHHICSVMLMIGYLFPNGHVWGAPMNVLHDWSEVFMYLCKISQATPHDYFTFVALSGMYLSWIWTRLIILPYTLKQIIVDYGEAALARPETTFEVHYVRSMSFVMSAMDILYVYWFILIS